MLRFINARHRHIHWQYKGGVSGLVELWIMGEQVKVLGTVSQVYFFICLLLFF